MKKDIAMNFLLLCLPCSLSKIY